jgi:hypothetical protein
MDQIAVLLAPGHVPDELGGSYEDACAALELPPVPGGYALYLLDQMNQRRTIISTDTTAVRLAELAYGDGGNGYLDNARVAAAGIVDVRSGWPEEYGGGPRCQFCRPLTRTGSTRARTLRSCSARRCSASGASRVPSSAPTWSAARTGRRAAPAMT